jgi:putative peptidoglycan lipid II flippase
MAHPLLAGAAITALGTLASRVLGMVRDIATAALLGLAGGGVMDAFVVAYRIPNLFRSLFGEGALTASYLPVFAAEREKDPRRAWQLTTAMLLWLCGALFGLVLAGEAVYGIVWLTRPDDPAARLLAGLGAMLLPYMLLICVAAQLTATLNALGHFAVPALTPTILNLCWLAAAAAAAQFAPDGAARAYVLAGAILLGGVLQIGVQLPPLWRRGFRLDFQPQASREPLRRIGHTLLPMVLGLTATQINTFLDSMVAWGLAAPLDGPEFIPWLGGAVRYPLQAGAAAAIYYGERLYQFPLGIVGLAVATAIFPLLSRHAARGERAEVGRDLTRGLRLVLALGLPAAAGLMLLAAPVARLLFERGQFTPDDTARTARMIACYAAGVWAYCALPVVVRGFYALGDTAAPAKVALAMVGLNLALNLTLIWPLAEAGLAVATAFCAAVELLWLTALFSRRHARLGWPALAATAARAVLATLAMTAVGTAVLAAMPADARLTSQALRVAAPLAAAAATYFGVYWLIARREAATLFRRAG